MVERKEIGKETTSQDLTDHRALLEQLHTIRTASLEERHGSERDWKAKKNVTEIENHAIRIHWYLISTNKSMTKPKPRTQMYKNNQKYDFDASIFILHRIILFNPGMVSEFYLWWCEQVSVRIIYFLQILQCTFNKIHRITSRSAHAFVAKQQSKKTNKHWPQMAMESKTNIQTWNSSILTIIWACTKRSSNCEGRMLFLTRGPYALLRFPAVLLTRNPCVWICLRGAYAKSLDKVLCTNMQRELTHEAFSITMLQHQASFFLA